MLSNPRVYAVRGERVKSALLNIRYIHREASFVVICKPSGLLSVPGRGVQGLDCVVNRVKADVGACIEQPAVHRLDMDTSGLMVLALTREAHRELSRQFELRTVKKVYIAVLEGVLEADGGCIELAFRLDPDNRPWQVYDPVQGKLGVTQWRRLGVENGRTRVEFSPSTGRTHQLRLHAAHKKGLGMPIVGDRLYGNGIAPGELLLHASELHFDHPETGARMSFYVPPAF